MTEETREDGPADWSFAENIRVHVAALNESIDRAATVGLVVRLDIVTWVRSEDGEEVPTVGAKVLRPL